MAADRYQGKAPGGTEYGGKEGLIQTADDGHPMTGKEKAMVMRHHGIQGDLAGDDTDLNVATGVDVDQERTPWVDIAHRDKALRRAGVDQKLSGRQIGEAL